MARIVTRALRPLDAVRVENPCSPGTPDVNLTLGWIELKQLPKWPRLSEEAPILLPLFTPQQRIWLLRRETRGGRTWLLLRVGSEWLLYRGTFAARNLGKINKQRMLDEAVRIFNDKTITGELQQCLSQESGSPI